MFRWGIIQKCLSLPPTRTWAHMRSLNGFIVIWIEILHLFCKIWKILVKISWWKLLCFLGKNIISDYFYAFTSSMVQVVSKILEMGFLECRNIFHIPSILSIIFWLTFFNLKFLARYSLRREIFYEMKFSNFLIMRRAMNRELST